MEEPIEESYFNWLCAKVLEPKSTNHLDLMRILHTTEFVWVVARDVNRAEDGMELREEFLMETQIEFEQLWWDTPCSLLEMFISFSRRASFQTDEAPKEWFWRFMENLRLDEYRRVSKSDETIINDILHTFIWRTYGVDGYGGMFPLRNPSKDQRKVELYYQFCEYLDDQGLLYGLL